MLKRAKPFAVFSNFIARCSRHRHHFHSLVSRPGCGHDQSHDACHVTPPHFRISNDEATQQFHDPPSPDVSLSRIRTRGKGERGDWQSLHPGKQGEARKNGCKYSECFPRPRSVQKSWRLPIGTRRNRGMQRRSSGVWLRLYACSVAAVCIVILYFRFHHLLPTSLPTPSPVGTTIAIVK
jgi:hypothetical protein